MRIAIDLDETVVEFLKGFVNFYNEVYKGDLKLGDFKEFSIAHTLLVGKDESKRLRKEYSDTKFFDEMEIIEGAKETIDSLGEENEIFFMTAREDFHHEKTKKFIEQNFPYAKLFFSGDYHGVHKNKDELCKENKIDVLIEDSELSDKYAEAGIKVVLLDKEWNKHLNHKNIIRVKDWREVMDELARIKNEFR